MKRRLNKKGIIVVSLIIFFFLLGIITTCIYFIKLGPVSKENKPVEIKIEKGDVYSNLASKLEDLKLIKSPLAYKIYVKTHHLEKLNSCTYELNQNMNVKKILKVLSSGKCKEDSITITFKEGINIRKIASIIGENTEEDVYNLLQDKEYLNSLINEYWFINEDILNENIYYPLEGYLFPDTYQFTLNASVKDIFKVMLDEMDTKLSKYKNQIDSSSYSVHQLLTLASIVELEAGTSHERSGVASVFYNRLKDGWTLGSDVTTYYAAKKDFTVDLTAAELNECNSYNTRGTCFKGLPVGPIASPSIESIEGVMNPTNSDYYYFVADKNGNTYFTKSDSEHLATIARLKSEGLWYVYE